MSTSTNIIAEFGAKDRRRQFMEYQYTQGTTHFVFAPAAFLPFIFLTKLKNSMCVYIFISEVKEMNNGNAIAILLIIISI